jgi:NAD(P)-dependent dehydrogenase (short-subunit alcohol dehydrogenase family)
MYTRTLATKLAKNKIMSASIHPGWVKTDMGGDEADLEPEAAADDIYKRIVTLAETGQFWFKQDKFPW